MVLSQAYLEWEQRTEQRGRTEGEQQGALKEAQSLILRLLTRRLDKIPSTMKSQLENLSLTQLEFLGEALLDFANVDDLENWLRLHS